MSGLISITVQEQRGFVAVPADLDKLAVVVGPASGGSAGLSPFYLSGSSAVTALGYGDGVDTLCQIIEQVQSSGNGKKFPAAFYKPTLSTTGSYGTIDVTGVAGTSVVSNDATVHPYGTYGAQIKFITGCTIGVAGGTLQWSLDDGRNWSNTVALGTATSYTIPNSNVKFNFAAGATLAGDIAKVRTLAPAPSTSDVDAMFTALAASTVDMGLLVFEFPVDATMGAHITTGVSALRAVGKRVAVIARTRLPNWETPESEETWAAAVEADFAAYTNSSVHVRSTYGLITDAMTSRQYRRSDLAQFAADAVRVGRGDWPCCPADLGTGLGGVPNVKLVDASGTTIGHDEGPRGAVTGLSDDSQGNRFGCQQRIAEPPIREAVFNTVPWVMYAADEKIKNLMVRRLANAIERTAVIAGVPSGGAKVFYTKTGTTTGTLSPTSRKAIQGAIYQAVSSEFSTEIDNAKDAAIDTGLVQVSPSITLSGGNLVAVSVTVAPSVGGFVLSLSLTLAIQE